MSDPLFTEFLEAHGQEKILEDIKEEHIEPLTKEKTDDDEPTNKIANADISDFEVCGIKMIYMYMLYFLILWLYIFQYLKIKSGKKSEVEVLNKSSETKTEFHTIVIRGLPYKVKKAMLKEFFKPLKLDSIRIPPKIKGVAYIGFKNKCDAEQCLIKNKSFISM